MCGEYSTLYYIQSNQLEWKLIFSFYPGHLQSACIEIVKLGKVSELNVQDIIFSNIRLTIKLSTKSNIKVRGTEIIKIYVRIWAQLFLGLFNWWYIKTCSHARCLDLVLVFVFSTPRNKHSYSISPFSHDTPQSPLFYWSPLSLSPLPAQQVYRAGPHTIALIIVQGPFQTELSSGG